MVDVKLCRFFFEMIGYLSRFYRSLLGLYVLFLKLLT